MTLLGIDHVAYIVNDIDSSVAFYERVLGLHEVGSTPDRSFVAMSWGANVHDIALMQGTPQRGGSVHHVAITLEGGPTELRAFADRARELGVAVEMILDHKVSQSLYFRDPDENLIEVLVDQPRDQWEHIAGAVTYSAPLSL
jgi:catechol 2,3-dioxygenase